MSVGGKSRLAPHISTLRNNAAEAFDVLFKTIDFGGQFWHANRFAFVTAGAVVMLAFTFCFGNQGWRETSQRREAQAQQQTQFPTCSPLHPPPPFGWIAWPVLFSQIAPAKYANNFDFALSLFISTGSSFFLEEFF